MALDEKIKKWKVFIIPHWHFDAVWQLPYEEYFDITSRNMMDLLEFLDVEPEYRFCLDQTIYIEEFLKRYPELKEKLIKHVKAGSIEPVCGGYAQPDTNLPSGEFLARNTILYKTFMKKVFDVDAECGWYLDTYGQSAQLPQIFKESGIKYFTFWRGVPKEPPSEFLWEGIDGTRILTHRMPLGYSIGYLPTGENRYYYFIQTVGTDDAISFLENLSERLKGSASTNSVFIPNGGDFAPPQRNVPEVVREWRKRRSDMDMSIATASQFFKTVETSAEKLPVIKGEFNPLFRGTYSTRIKIKQANRKVEDLYLTAEKFATMSSLFGFPYPEKDLEKALKLILLNQFHDAINGEVTDDIYEKIMRDYDKVEDVCNEILEGALKNIAEKIDMQEDGIPIVIFNQLSWTRVDMAKVRLAFGDAGARGVLLRDCHGRDVPFQLTSVSKNPDGTLNNVNLVFIAENVPALGYKVYFAVPTDNSKTQEFKSSVRAHSQNGRYWIENQDFSITIDPISKMITSVYDKKADREALQTEKCLGNVLFDEPDYGSACHVNGTVDMHNVAIPIKDLPNPEVTENTMKCVPKERISEGGPIKATIEIFARLNGSRYRQLVTIYDKIKRIDFQTDIEFENENRRIRVALPVNVEDGEIWHEIPYGAIKREEGEYPAINWTDLSNKDYGVTLINQGLPGNNIVKNVMLITLLRSIDAMYLGTPLKDPRHERVGRMYLEKSGRFFPYHPMGRMALEKGSHSFKYALYPHEGTWREAKSYKKALEFNNPLISVKATSHKGSLPKEQSFLSVEPENLIVTAVKKCGENIIVRFYEAEGKEVKGKLRFFKPVKSAWRTNLLEEKQETMKVKEKEVPVQAGAFKILSMLLETE